MNWTRVIFDVLIAGFIFYIFSAKMTTNFGKILGF